MVRTSIPFVGFGFFDNMIMLTVGAHIYIYLYIYIYIYTHIHIHYIYIYICKHIYIYIYVYLPTCLHTNLSYPHACIPAVTNIPPRQHTRTPIYVPAYQPTSMNKCQPPYLHTGVCEQTHSFHLSLGHATQQQKLQSSHRFGVFEAYISNQSSYPEDYFFRTPVTTCLKSYALGSLHAEISPRLHAHVRVSTPLGSIYIYIYMYIYVCMYVCMYVCIYIYTHLSIYLSIYLYLSVYLSIYLSLSLYIYIHTIIGSLTAPTYHTHASS